MLSGERRRIKRWLSMTLMWWLLVASLVLAVFALQGCGGGGGGEAPLTPPSGVFKTLRVGNSWTYDVSGTITDLETGKSENVKGTIRIDIDEASVNGATYSVMKLTLDITTTSGVPITSTEFILIAQDESRSIWMIGMSTPEGYDLLVEPVIMWRSPMEVGQVVTYTGNFASGKVEIGSYRVEGIERVSVPAGSFVAFKVAESSTTKDAMGETLLSEASTSWVVPEIGGAVRQIVTITDYEDEFTLKLTAVLKTYK
jgi:hypothetical protein